MKATITALDEAWAARCQYIEKCCKLKVAGDRLWFKSDVHKAEWEKNKAMCRKIWAEGDIYRAEGDMLWAEAVLKERGNIFLFWQNWNPIWQAYDCYLATGEIFRFPVSQEPKGQSQG